VDSSAVLDEAMAFVVRMTAVAVFRRLTVLPLERGEGFFERLSFDGLPRGRSSGRQVIYRRGQRARAYGWDMLRVGGISHTGVPLA